MSILTKQGDDGFTNLMYNRRVSKAHPRVEASGCVDELNAAIGLARAHASQPFLRDNLLAIQRDLVVLMGELSIEAEDSARYFKDGFLPVTVEMIENLEKLIHQIEAQNIVQEGWVLPGASKTSALLDLARTICRRAERRACALQEAGRLKNPQIVIYLNRLSDLLWLFARWSEANAGADAASPG